MRSWRAVPQTLVVDGFEVPTAAVVCEPAEGAVVELHVPLVLDEGHFRPPLARYAPRPRARDDAPREPGGAEVGGRARVEHDRDGSRRPHTVNGKNRPLNLPSPPMGRRVPVLPAPLAPR